MSIEKYGIYAILLYLLGVIFACVALWRSRTYQGAAAWVVALIGFPLLAVPAFIFFGRNKFYGYVKARKELDHGAARELKESDKINEEKGIVNVKFKSLEELSKEAKQPGFTRNNNIRLLVNAKTTYDEILTEIEKAKKYILFQYYIFQEDNTGRQFKEALIKKAKEGVKVYFLYDGVATKLTSTFINECKAVGIDIRSFASATRRGSHFQVNFRNHRKLVVIDSHVALLGGINIGNDSLGLNKKIGYWRDTHIRIEGPSALSAQLSFAKDWYWATSKMPNLDWNPQRSPTDSNVIVFHTGPADEFEVCLMAHLSLINAAEKRIWISNPYFVPSEGIMNGLAVAALRGVEVCIILPKKSDIMIVNLASKPHIEKLIQAGVHFFYYEKGFLHQKVMLIDNDFGTVGSANLDSRSLFLNFELLAGSDDKKFVQDLEEMFKMDFKDSKKIELKDLTSASFPKKLISRAANLVGPMI